MAKLFIIATLLFVQAYCSISDTDVAAHQSHMPEDINTEGSDGRNVTDDTANEAAATTEIEETRISAADVPSPKPKTSSTHPPLQHGTHEKSTPSPPPPREEPTPSPSITTTSTSKSTEITKEATKERMKPLEQNSVGTTPNANVPTKQPKHGHNSSNGLYASFLVSITFTTMILFLN